MKKPVIKLIFGIAILFLLSFAFRAFLLRVGPAVNIEYDLEQRSSQIKALSDAINRELNLYSDVTVRSYERSLERVVLPAVTLSAEMQEGWDGKPRMYKNGAVIRVHDGKVEYPEGFPKGIVIDADSLVSNKGVVFSGSQTDNEIQDAGDSVIYYLKVNGPFYYVEWESLEEAKKRTTDIYDVNESLKSVGEAFNMHVLLIEGEPDDNGLHSVFFASKAIPVLPKAEDYGITKEMFDAVTKSTDSVTADTLTDTVRIVSFEGDYYEVFLKEIKPVLTDGSTIVAFLIPYNDSMNTIQIQVLVLLVVFVMAGVIFLVWCFSTIQLVRNYSLNADQCKEFEPKKTYRKAFSLIALGGVAILCVAALILSLFRLYEICNQVNYSLQVLEERVMKTGNQRKQTERGSKKIYEEFAVNIADMLSERPEYMDAETLQELSDLIEADYIMVFDHDGNEVVSNSRYTGLSLGTDPSSSTYDFRLLLNGVPLITHDLMTDESTRLTNVMIGASVDDPENKGNYQALLIAVPEEKINFSPIESTDEILSSTVSGGLLAFTVDPADQLVKNSSDKRFIGVNIVNAGIPTDKLHDGYRDFFTLGGKPYYGECKEIDGLLYFYTAEQDSIYKNVLLFAVLVGAVSFALLSVLVLSMLFGYRKRFEEWSKTGEELVEKLVEVQVPGGKWKRSVDPSARWKLSLSAHGRHTPFHNAFLTLKFFLFAIVVMVVASWLINRGKFDDSLVTYILYGSWAKGFNLFSFTNIMFLLGELIIVVSVIKFALFIASTALGTKGETICRLLINFVNYAGVLCFIYFFFYYLGFDPKTLLASLGLLSFAISLGAKDLITDIVAGLSIVFEGEYQVGDIIEVNGYRGKVLEIGVRTTKLEGKGGNIKIIGNRDVKNVINMTRMNSWYPLEINISSDQPLANIETLLYEQLPRIGKDIPEIVSGPFYQGITSLGKGTMTLSITAECNEADYFTVQRALNRAVQELFEEKEIKLM